MAIPALIAVGAIMAAAGVGGAISSGALGKTESGSSNINTANFRNAITDAQKDAQWAGTAYEEAAGRKGPRLGDPRLAGGASMDYATYDSSTIDRSNELATRGLQMDMASRLRDQMDGKGPSLAQQQLNMGVNQSLKAQMAAAASARGGGTNAALAMRNLGNSADEMRAGLVGQAGMLRLQEQMGAQGQYAALTNAMRGQDLGWTQMQHQGGMMNTSNRQQALGTNAAFAQQAGLANQAAQNQFAMGQFQGDMNTMALNDAQQRALLGYRGSMMDRALTAEERDQEFQIRHQQMDYEASESKKRRNLALFGGLVGGGGSMMSMGAQGAQSDK